MRSEKTSPTLDPNSEDENCMPLPFHSIHNYFNSLRSILEENTQRKLIVCRILQDSVHYMISLLVLWEQNLVLFGAILGHSLWSRCILIVVYGPSLVLQIKVQK